MNSKNGALGDRIRQARKTLGLTQQEFASQLAVTQPTVHRWEKGFYDPDEEALQRLAGMTKLSPAYFRYGEPSASSDPASAIVVGYVAAGQKIHALGESRGEVVASPTGENLVALRVNGANLAPTYRDGDLLFYDRNDEASEAQFIGRECVVKLADGPTLLKRVEKGRQRGHYALTACNEAAVDEARLEWARPIKWVRRA